jgi:cytochrome c-type biogenesis protein CcmF
MFVNDMVAIFDSPRPLSQEDLSRYLGKKPTKDDLGIQANIRILGKTQSYFVRPIFLVQDRQVSFVHDIVPELGIKITLNKIDPQTGKFTFETSVGQRDYIVLKAMEKPLINVLWIGTLVVMLGFGMAVYRRYTEFVKMRDKGLETAE